MNKDSPGSKWYFGKTCCSRRVPERGGVALQSAGGGWRTADGGRRTADGGPKQIAFSER
ncbi:hypothetical protein [Paenibacillus macerans]|uniref:hypothetical protein n=1 Tax=Paenibacillus macerans TaxID=44252 RepID=UPI00203F9C57|nr:hypothetical protein [Paenibacillus macerans]MCM3702970.1 hypothetical protein [Paenibacillus macerans]